MNEQGALLILMIENEAKKHEASHIDISNFEFTSPKQIKLQADEIAFITMIRISATSDFKLSFKSADESREIERTITSAQEVENNSITKHLSTIKFEISNGDDYQVSVVKIKFIR